MAIKIWVLRFWILLDFACWYFLGKTLKYFGYFLRKSNAQKNKSFGILLWLVDLSKYKIFLSVKICSVMEVRFYYNFTFGFFTNILQNLAQSLKRSENVAQNKAKRSRIPSHRCWS